MALNPSAAFSAANDKAYKTPMYTVAFQTQLGAATWTDVDGFTRNEFTVSDVLTGMHILWLEQADDPTWTPDEWVGYTAIITTQEGVQYRRIIDTNTADTITFNESLPINSVVVGDEFRIDFYEEFCTYQPAEDIFDLKAPRLPYISNISGGNYSITPDEGSTSSATLKIEMQDNGGYITNMLANATGNLQKKKCIVKAGYVGLKASEMLTVFTGEVTDYNYNDDGSWTFSVSDAIRELNRTIFRAASEDNVVQVRGNPINILLGLLISNNGDRTKGKYDYLSALDSNGDRIGGIGLNMDLSQIDIEAFEEIRDAYFPTSSVLFTFRVEERISANDFLKNEIYKPLNMYPIIKGDGRYSARVYRPILPPYTTRTITEDVMVGIPRYSGNLTSLVNEVRFSYDYDGDEFGTIEVYVDAESINERSSGDRVLEIETTGLNSDNTDAAGFVERSANRIFDRYAVPPIKLTMDVLFKEMLIESGDILGIENKFLPNLETGTFGLEDVQMEVLKRTVDWKRGKVKLDMLQTGFRQRKYGAISPKLTVTSVVDTDTVEVSDVKDYEVGFKVSIYSYQQTRTGQRPYIYRELVADDYVITDITGNEVTLDSALPSGIAANWVLVYNDTADLTDYQEAWAYILPESDPNAYRITP